MSEIHVLYRLLRYESQRAVMIDVGAHYGESLLPFAKDGWEIHAFEPDPVNRTRLYRTCRDFATVTVIPKAVSDQIGERTLYRSDESSGISSLTPFVASHQPSEAVEVTTLGAYVDQVRLPDIGFLKIDAEGYDRFILQGYPWGRLRPRAILCEFEDSKTVPLGYTWKDLADDMVALGYRVMVSEWYPVRRYGNNHAWRRFQPYPTSLVDETATGNLMAVCEGDFGRLSAICRRSCMRLSIRHRADLLLGSKR